MTLPAEFHSEAAEGVIASARADARSFAADRRPQFASLILQHALSVAEEHRAYGAPWAVTAAAELQAELRGLQDACGRL